MNNENLTMMGKGITSTEQAKEMGRKGGLVRSPAKRYAAQMRDLKKKKGDNKVLDFFENLALDSQLSEIHMLRMFNQLFPKIKSEHAQQKMLDTYVKIHSCIHGTKQFNTNLNVDVNGNNSFGEVNFIMTSASAKEDLSKYGNDGIQAAFLACEKNYNALKVEGLKRKCLPDRVCNILGDDSIQRFVDAKNGTGRIVDVKEKVVDAEVIE